MHMKRIGFDMLIKMESQWTGSTDSLKRSDSNQIIGHESDIASVHKHIQTIRYEQ